MNNFVILAIVLAGIFIAVFSSPKKSSKLKPLSHLKLQPRRPLTAREQQMYFRLTETLTDCAVFPQMPLAALLTTSDRQDRNRFDRKIADFLVCTKTLTPIAVIELDDPSHNNKAAQDADRDAMLRNAGYQTIRYRDYPTPIQLRQDIETAFKKVSGLTAQSN
ncbi:DUF2726 domain-containing protein [Pseudoduganella sp. FT26W]|uniref:DUF2726 domain-containing protein n=1 Tax=Duganella aquatilis TaxID=2666082 RepID=A0A844DCV8_9BURK|nr:DUF2726 domain-containing protein [Duganella aquatilis]MRW85264.1 DUF2726 domain-containing protein [Duganella aquatilis]